MYSQKHKIKKRIIYTHQGKMEDAAVKMKTDK